MSSFFRRFSAQRSVDDQEAHAGYLRTRYFPFFDGTRYVLVATVVLDHAGDVWPLLNGGVAVLVFFVMSGYLITTLLCRENATAGVNLRAFLRRRVFRIAPLYFFTIGVYILLMATLRWPDPDGFGPVWRHALFLSEYTNSSTFGQAWSLGVEEKFYLLWPLVGFVAIRREWQRMMVGVVMLAAFSLFWFRPETHLQHYASIMSGCLLALLLHSGRGFEAARRVYERRWAFPAVLILTAACLFTICYSEDLRLASSRLPITQLATVGFPCTVAALFGWVLVRRSGVVPLLCVSSMRYGGRLSYAIYLTHALALIAFYAAAPGVSGVGPGWTLPVALGLATLIAIPFHHLIELPMIARGKRPRRSEDEPVRPRSAPSPA